MSRTLPVARDAFLTAMNRDTAGSDRPRYTAVLDAMIEWSLARPEQLRFRDDESSDSALSLCVSLSNTLSNCDSSIDSDAVQSACEPVAMSGVSGPTPELWRLSTRGTEVVTFVELSRNQSAPSGFRGT